MYRQWPNVSRVFQILRLMESALPFCCNNSTSNGLVLDMSKKQQLHSEICKHARRPKSRSYQGSGMASSTRCWRESFTRTVANNQTRTFANICKRLILTLDAHHAHTMEPFTIRITTLNNYTTRQILISRGLFILKLHENAPSLAYVANQFLGK